MPAKARRGRADSLRKAELREPPRGGAIVLVAACWSYVLAFAILLGGVADGTVDTAQFFNVDAPRGWFLAEMLRTGEYDIRHNYWSVSPYILDVAVMLPLYFAVGYVGAVYVYMFLAPLFSMAGWVVLCAAVFGKSAHRAALVVALHALPFIVMGWGGDNVFFTQLIPYCHYAVWAALPWLLWLVVRILQGSQRHITGLAALTAVTVLSDPIILPWFVAPLAAALFLFAKSEGKRKKGKKDRAKSAHALCITVFWTVTGGAAAGWVAAKTLPLSFLVHANRIHSTPTFKEITNVIGNLADYAVLLAAHNPLSAIVWIAFAVIAGRCFMASLPLKSFGRALSSADIRFLHLFIPLSMAASVAAVVATGIFPYMSDESFAAAGGFDGKRHILGVPAERGLGENGRYMLPMLFFPLFVGWLLYLPRLRVHVAVAAIMLIAIIAAPKAAAIFDGRLNPYAHPFYECLHSAAKRLNAQAAINIGGTEYLAAPGYQWKKHLGMHVLRGKNGYVYGGGVLNSQMKMGKFDFVITNASGGKVGYYTPEREQYICSYDEWHNCFSRWHPALILDGQAVRAAAVVQIHMRH